MKKPLLPCTLVFAAGLAASGGTFAEPVLAERIAAVAGDQIILLSDLRKQSALAWKELEQVSKARGLPQKLSKDKVLRDTLDQMINEVLIEKEAGEMKVTVTTEEVDRAMDNMARENGVDVETLKKAVTAQGLDLYSYRKKLRNQLLRLKVLNLRVRARVKISDAEARQYYNDQVRDVRATGAFEGAQILVRVSPNARAADVAKLRKRAEDIRARLERGEDFATVAKEASDDSATAASGGSMGQRRPEKSAGPLERAFLDLEDGELAGPIRTSAGFHVLKLLTREALGVQPFSGVKDRIVMQLTEQEMLRQESIWLKEVRAKAYIDVRL